MSNTQKRILSALFILTLVFSLVAYGEWGFFLLVALVSILGLDEVCINLFNQKRFSSLYIIAQLMILSLVFCNMLLGKEFNLLFVLLSGFLVIFPAMAFLFFADISKLQNKARTAIWNIVAAVVFLPIISIIYLLKFQNWEYLLLILIAVTALMDSGAWLVGTMIGKNKLCPTISPNKTIEGFIGGIVISSLGSTALWCYFLNNDGWILAVIVFGLLAIISQCGDLFQSKLKRMVNIKDSSSLIPGHGGVYDRLDSLVFATPIFVIFVHFFKLEDDRYVAARYYFYYFPMPINFFP
ncbi:phosphatidate cytidylyltransferase [Bacteriovoracaceae bacterium]|nr:phosphatidate cytidylyltransferase [Bacteriovoracaceae bacterium]